MKALSQEFRWRIAFLTSSQVLQLAWDHALQVRPHVWTPQTVSLGDMPSNAVISHSPAQGRSFNCQQYSMMVTTQGLEFYVRDTEIQCGVV